MLSWGMSWFSLVSISQWLWYGTLVVKAITIYFWYGYRSWWFCWNWDWLESWLCGIKVSAFGCWWMFISGNRPGHSTLVSKGFVHFVWHGDSNGCLVLIATHQGFALMTYLTGFWVFIVWQTAFITYCHHFCDFCLVHLIYLKQFNVVMGHVVVFIGINVPMFLILHLGS